jgi:HSP20 family protein
MTSRDQQQQQTGLSRRSQQQAMPSVFANPFNFMRRFSEGMEQLFGDFGTGGLMQRGFDQMSQWTPQIEMFEREGQLHIRADLPGMNKDDVQIELQDDAVVLRGERREERREEREGMYRTEVSYGSFYREVPLPNNVDANEANATFRDGVLEITMPVMQGQGRGRRLEIQESEGEQQQQQPRQRSHAAGSGR